MTNTTELRNRFDSELSRYLNPAINYGYENLLRFLQSEIETAEKAKVEEVIEWVEFLQKTELRNDYRKLIKELKLHFKSLA